MTLPVTSLPKIRVQDGTGHLPQAARGHAGDRNSSHSLTHTCTWGRAQAIEEVSCAWAAARPGCSLQAEIQKRQRAQRPPQHLHLRTAPSPCPWSRPRRTCGEAQALPATGNPENVTPALLPARDWPVAEQVDSAPTGRAVLAALEPSAETSQPSQQEGVSTGVCWDGSTVTLVPRLGTGVPEGSGRWGKSQQCQTARVAAGLEAGRVLPLSPWVRSAWVTVAE